MDREIEKRILERAFARGLITPHRFYLAEKASSVQESSGIRMLVDQNWLDQAMVISLEAEISAEESKASPPPVRVAEGDFVQWMARRVMSEKLQAKFGPYVDLEFIGEGGMARVYRAYDPRLNRRLALKFLRVDDQKLRDRLLVEARAQARIQHEHVCKVFEVSEIEGHPYIAMQYINGRTLRELIKELSLEEKIKIMKEVAEAVHAAHRVGLIHRDLKTVNVMVERNQEGEWVPYVMDFGLARDIGDPGLTRTGIVVGSPLYMSPEQARGEVHGLDRRTDIYSLGVTLYEIVTGKLPLEAETGVGMLVKISYHEPIPVRRRNPQIPSDLETIIMKCLEKEPARRYDSAKSLAEDLTRYLEGDPILARRASWKYRLWKKVRKHRATVITVSVALVCVLIFAALGMHARWTVQKQTALARQFGSEIERMEETMRIAYMLPLHNMRSEKNTVRLRMKRIEDAMKQLGSIGYGPGHYALGRGYLALHEYEKARRHLEEAWNAGYREAEVSFALGRVLGELYRKELEASDQIKDRVLREQKRKDAERIYFDRAVRFLKQGKVDGAETPYAEALVAFYMKRYEEALAKSRESFARTPWLYESKKLEGDIFVRMADDQQQAGRYEQAEDYYRRAGNLYHEALSIAHSDAALYEAECRRGVHLLEVGTKKGIDPGKSIEQNLLSCDRALTADPEAYGVYHIKAVAYLQFASYQIWHGQNESKAVEKALFFGDLALRSDPQNADAYVLMGDAELRKVASRSRDSGSLDAAANYFRKGIELKPNNSEAYNGFAIAQSMKADGERLHGRDPRKFLSDAIHGYQTAIQLNPSNSYAYHNLGGNFSVKAEYELSQGLDPTSSLNLALQNFRKAIEKNPRFTPSWEDLGECYSLLADYNQLNGIDPASALTEGRKAFDQAATIDSKSWKIFLLRGELETIAFAWTIKQSRPDSNRFEASESALMQALKLSMDAPEISHAIAKLYLKRAEWLVNQKSYATALPDINKGLSMVRAALKQGITSEAEANQAVLLYLQALCTTGAKQREAATAALHSLHHAIQSNRNLLTEYSSYLARIQELSAKRPNGL